MDDNLDIVTGRSREQWNQARRKVFLQRLFGALGLSKGPEELLSFEEVQAKLRLTQSAYRGLQEVPLDKIVGSVGRYHDFTRTFLPLVENDGWRWRRVADLQTSLGLPPIELYKVGEAYFVKDGNHRVSVARQFNAKTIEAYVWEYETPTGGLPSDTQLDDLIVKAEYRAFLDKTRLDVLRPEQQIVLTEPGMYPALDLEIDLYHRNLEEIDQAPTEYESAVTAWYDMRYTLAVDLIRESGVLKLFPGRTEADLYIWIARHWHDLSEQYGERLSLREVVASFTETKQQRLGPVERVMHSVASSVSGLVQSITPERPEVPPSLPENDSPLGRLLEDLYAFEPEMAYQGERGEAWRAWRQTLRDKIQELLGLNYQPSDRPDVEVIRTDLISGVERTQIVLWGADGLRLPGYVMVPADVAGQLPALLVYPGTGTVRQTAGLERSAQHGNALAVAQAGYVTITIEQRGFGELAQVGPAELDSVARLIGRSWLGMVIEDGFCALDYLQSRPDVDPERLGVTGLGLGGGLALYTAALDERVRAVVIEGFLGIDLDAGRLTEHSPYLVPGLRQYALLSDIARLIVPRPVLYAYSKQAPMIDLARRSFDHVRPTYEAFKCPDRTRFVAHDLEHEYSGWGARHWFDRWLIEEEDTSVLLWSPRD